MRYICSGGVIYSMMKFANGVDFNRSQHEEDM